ncbi:amidase [Flammula alnicola]|nr:amidase [Flammula alnicola]
MWPFSSNASIVNQKREERARALADVSQDNSGTQSAFLKATVSEIVARIEKGEWTAIQVLEAYIARAAYAHTKTNCLTEVMLGPARQRAAELDAEFAATKRLKGPLHVEITGYDTSVGFSQWANNPATKNADIVNHLLDAGAIIYVKTNIPQTMFAFECSNPVWGRTTNPYNENYTCGGSSGGEAALLAMDGSAAGVGTDIGGSLRIPTAYSASGRISYVGAKGPVPGFEGIKSVAGPMGRSVKDLEVISRVTFGAPGTDYAIPRFLSKLKFGYYTSVLYLLWFLYNYIKASPACKRAVLETVEALRDAGHECVEFELPESHIPFNLFAAITSSDGYKTMLSHLGPDPKSQPFTSAFVRTLAAWIMERFLGDKIFADTVRVTKAKGIADYYKLVDQRDAYKTRFYETVWAKYEFDSIIAPVQALPQLPHGGCDNFSALAEATIIYNVLDMPAGCLPVTRVDPTQDQLTEEWVKGPGLGSPMLEGGIYRGKKPLYDPEEAKGMPVNIQIVGKKWEEEKILAIMDVVDEALGKDRGFGPGAWDAYMNSKA